VLPSKQFTLYAGLIGEVRYDDRALLAADFLFAEETIAVVWLLTENPMEVPPLLRLLLCPRFSER
jgi:hypothetical protein